MWKLTDFGSLRHRSKHPQVLLGKVGAFCVYSILYGPSRGCRQGATGAQKRITKTASIKSRKIINAQTIVAYVFSGRCFYASIPSMRTTLHDTVNSRFYAPLEMALAAAKLSRNCPGFTDSEFLEAGVGRVIDEAITGRVWVQKLQQLVSMRLRKKGTGNMSGYFSDSLDVGAHGADALSWYYAKCG